MNEYFQKAAEAAQEEMREAYASLIDGCAIVQPTLAKEAAAKINELANQASEIALQLEIGRLLTTTGDMRDEVRRASMSALMKAMQEEPRVTARKIISTEINRRALEPQP